MKHRAYDAIRTMVERLGGTMVYVREGYPYGAWVISVGERRRVLEAGGNRSFPDLDGLHVPKRPNPQHWDDYSNALVPDAESRLLSLLR